MNKGPADVTAPKAPEGTDKQFKLIKGQIYEGSISGVDPLSKTMSVRITGQNAVVDHCVWGAGIFSGLLGFRLSYLPPLGTRVGLVYGTPSVIISTTSSDMPDPLNVHNRVLNDPLTKRAAFKIYPPVGKGPHRSAGHTDPQDLLEGEFEITNLLGVALTMLTTMARLSAGDKAKVEVSLLDDLVRIVSGTFRHSSVFGEDHIYNDGRLNRREDGTSYEHESFGQLGAKDPKLPLNGSKGVDFTQVDAILDTGRWRYSQFHGFLGDFIHTLVTDPPAVLGRYASDAARAGKSRIQQGMDGTVLVQSVAEIAIERVTRIPVPVEVKRPEDPTGVRKADFDKLENSFLKIWDYGTDMQDLPKTVYQLREYARWLSQYHMLARFHQLEKKSGEWTVPSEADAPAPSWLNKEDDVTQANPAMKAGGPKVDYIDTYSCYRIMRDGSQILLDGYGNCILLTQDGVRISSVRHLDLEAAGDMRIVVGQNLYCKVRRNIEVTSLVGGLRVKTRAWMQALCEWGSIWLKSDADDPNRPGYQAKTAGDQPFPDQDPAPVVLDRAVIMEGPLGGIAVRAGRQLLLQASGPSGSGSEDSGDVVLQSLAGRAQIHSQLDTRITASAGSIVMHAGRDILVVANRWLTDLRAYFFAVRGLFKFNPSGLDCGAVNATFVTGHKGIQGPEVAGPSPGGGRHYNHIYKLGANPRVPDTSLVDPDLEEAKKSTPPAPVFQKAPVWNFDKVPYVGDVLYESLSQQRLRTDSATQASYGTWAWSQDALQPAPRTGSGVPYPGTGSRHMVHLGGEDLHVPSAKAPKDQNKQTPLAKKAIEFRFRKA